MCVPNNQVCREKNSILDVLMLRQIHGHQPHLGPQTLSRIITAFLSLPHSVILYN